MPIRTQQPQQSETHRLLIITILESLDTALAIKNHRGVDGSCITQGIRANEIMLCNFYCAFCCAEKKNQGWFLFGIRSIRDKKSVLSMRSMYAIILVELYIYVMAIDVTIICTATWNVLLKEDLRKNQKKYSTMDATKKKELCRMHR